MIFNFFKKACKTIEADKKAYLEPCQTDMTERFVKTLNYFYNKFHRRCMAGSQMYLCNGSV